MSVAQSVNQTLRQVPAWPIYIVGGVVPLWWLYLGLTGGLGVEPINALERNLGQLGLQVLIASLAVTPLRTFTGINLIKFRRAIGLLCFYYICLHLLTWLVLDIQVPSRIWADILKRPYITIGMVGFLLLIPLAVTSNNLSIRKIGPVAWRRLHKLVYGAAILGGVHYVMVVKGWQAESLIYLGVILGLLVLRVKLPKRLVPA